MCPPPPWAGYAVASWRKLSCLLLVLAQKSSRLMMSDSFEAERGPSGWSVRAERITVQISNHELSRPPSVF